MKHLNILIKKVVLGSLASLTSQTNHAVANILETPEEVKATPNYVEPVITKPLTPKLLLRLNTDSSWDIKSHRSHRSHSSHRSHYSSTSGGTSSGTSGGSGGSTTSGAKPKTSDALGLTKATSSVSYTLGSRILKKGMTGNDVTELVNLFLKHKYLEMNNGSTTVTGDLTFDTTIEDVVKEFQKNSKLPVTGIMDFITIYKLKTK